MSNAFTVLSSHSRDNVTAGSVQVARTGKVYAFQVDLGRMRSGQVVLHANGRDVRQDHLRDVRFYLRHRFAEPAPTSYATDTEEEIRDCLAQTERSAAYRDGVAYAMTRAYELRTELSRRSAMIAQPVQQQQARAVGAQKVERESFPALTETADDRDALNIRNAAHFTASIRVGGVMQTIRDMNTMSEAGASAILMERSASNGRQGIVYAVTAGGRSAMVKRAVWEAEVNRALAALA